jgi:hypothetical protein
MTSVFNKLNLKDQTDILVLNPPSSFEPELTALKGVTILRDAREAKEVAFALAFVTTQKEIALLSKVISKKAHGDPIIWFAYPKGTSKKYKCDFNRDTGWDVLGSAGFETVRQVAIDEDWSALRFRRVEFVKRMKRRESFALTRQGKAKTR